MYPRKVTFTDEKLLKLLSEKGKLIQTGRTKSQEIEDIEKKMEEINQNVIKYEESVDISDLEGEAKVLTEEINAIITKMEDVKKRTFERMKASAPKELYATYEELEKEKKDKEEERNKIALKAQKYNDKIIPLTRKLMKPFLENEYEDYETVYLEGDAVVGMIFSHLEEFKESFAKRKK